MKFTKTQKKLIFFWLLFHTIGYLSFLLNFNPYISDNSFSSKANDNNRYYFLTPELDLCNVNGKDIVDPSGFYPFHKFSTYYNYRTYYNDKIKFVGIWGMYSHMEFAVYVVIPFLIIFLIVIYRKTVTTNT